MATEQAWEQVWDESAGMVLAAATSVVGAMPAVMRIRAVMARLDRETLPAEVVVAQEAIGGMCDTLVEAAARFAVLAKVLRDSPSMASPRLV